MFVQSSSAPERGGQITLRVHDYEAAAELLKRSMALIQTLRTLLRMKQAAVDKLKSMHDQVTIELQTCRELLKNAANARSKDLQQFKAAIDSYRASQQLSASYEVDLESTVRRLARQDQDLRSSRGVLQEKYDRLRVDYDNAQEQLSRANTLLQDYRQLSRNCLQVCHSNRSVRLGSFVLTTPCVDRHAPYHHAWTSSGRIAARPDDTSC